MVFVVTVLACAAGAGAGAEGTSTRARCRRRRRFAVPGLKHDGWKWVLAEVALLVVVGLLSMGLDRYRRWRHRRMPTEADETRRR